MESNIRSGNEVTTIRFAESIEENHFGVPQESPLAKVPKSKCKVGRKLPLITGYCEHAEQESDNSLSNVPPLSLSQIVPVALFIAG